MLNDLSSCTSPPEDLDLKPGCLHCPAHDLKLHPEDFEVENVYRFEGMTDPADSSVVYAIECNEGLKGVLVDTYAAFADSFSPEMARKLRLEGKESRG